MTTGEKIKARRKDLGYNAEYVAEKLGVSPATIYRYEKGDIEKVPGDVIISIANILATTPEHLMGWDTPSEEDELTEYIDMLRSRPELRLFLDTVKGASKSEVEENVRFLDALRQAKNND